MTRTVVHFLRHGEVHNPDGILYGRLPGFRLSDTGQRQALTVAEHLADHDIVHVVASPLTRARISWGTTASTRTRGVPDPCTGSPRATASPEPTARSERACDHDE